MRQALRRMAVLGIDTNWEFLRALLDEPDFEAGKVHTAWVEERLGAWKPGEGDPPTEARAAAALILAPRASSANARDAYSPWLAADAFRAGRGR